MKVKTAQLQIKGKSVPICHPLKIDENECPIQKNPIISHPSHYQGNKFEVIDIIEDFELGFNLGNALKYLLRAGKKNPGCEGFCEDLQKSIWYMQREIDKVES